MVGGHAANQLRCITAPVILAAGVPNFRATLVVVVVVLLLELVKVIN